MVALRNLRARAPTRGPGTPITTGRLQWHRACDPEPAARARAISRPRDARPRRSPQLGVTFRTLGWPDNTRTGVLRLHFPIGGKPMPTVRGSRRSRNELAWRKGTRRSTSPHRYSPARRNALATRRWRSNTPQASKVLRRAGARVEKRGRRKFSAAFFDAIAQRIPGLSRAATRQDGCILMPPVSRLRNIAPDFTHRSMRLVGSTAICTTRPQGCHLTTLLAAHKVPTRIAVMARSRHPKPEVEAAI